MKQLRAYAQLIRLPNLPTAFADVGLAGLALYALPGRDPSEPFPWLSLTLLALASACLYCAGMVWNDFFDIEQDRRERPFRPLPSGRITRRQAAILGVSLMLVGGLLPLFVSRESFYIAALLIGAIFLYDGLAKRTPLGPVCMGLCRFLNVLLGLSAYDPVLVAWKLHLALVVGLYIVGVTWFARTEARRSERAFLQLAAVVMFVSLCLALVIPLYRPPGTSSPVFPYLLVLLGFLLGFPIYRAIRTPSPPLVQAAVKRCLMGLIILDAVLATGVGGIIGLALLVLLVPSVLLNWQKWLYAT